MEHHGLSVVHNKVR